MLLAEEEKLSPGSALGPYVVQDYLASGATATLYRVRDTRDGHVFAAKVMGPELSRNDILRERFVSEAEVLKLFDHPNIVRLHDALSDANGNPVFIMEYIDGSTLDEYLPLHPGGLSEVLTLSIAIQLLDALVYAHARGVVHRDLKPSNVLLEQDHFGGLKAYIADFGLAKIVDSRSKTATGLRLGTIAYMAPEQVRDSSRVDPRADIYALGITLYECLTGALPFPHASLREVLESQLTKPVPPVRNQRLDLSPEWDHIIARACAKEREERFADAATMLAEIGKLSRSLSLDERTTQAVAPVRLQDFGKPPNNPTSAGRPGMAEARARRVTGEAKGLVDPFLLPFPGPPGEQEGLGLGIASTVELDSDQIKSLTASPPPLLPEAPNTTRDEGPLTSWVFTSAPPLPPKPQPVAPQPSAPVSHPEPNAIPVAFWILSGVGALVLLVVLAWLVI